MAYSAERKILARRELQSLLGPRAITRDSASREDDREHIGAKHLCDLNRIISDYYAPQRASNCNALVEDEMTAYISFPEKRNSNLSLRLAELEKNSKLLNLICPTFLLLQRL